MGLGICYARHVTFLSPLMTGRESELELSQKLVGRALPLPHGSLNSIKQSPQPIKVLLKGDALSQMTFIKSPSFSAGYHRPLGMRRELPGLAFWKWIFSAFKLLKSRGDFTLRGGPEDGLPRQETPHGKEGSLFLSSILSSLCWDLRGPQDSTSFPCLSSEPIEK